MKQKYIQLLKSIIKEVDEDQKKLLTSNDTPLNIANKINILQSIKIEIAGAIDFIDDINL